MKNVIPSKNVILARQSLAKCQLFNFATLVASAFEFLRVLSVAKTLNRQIEQMVSSIGTEGLWWAVEGAVTKRRSRSSHRAGHCLSRPPRLSIRLRLADYWRVRGAVHKFGVRPTMAEYRGTVHWIMKK